MNEQEKLKLQILQLFPDLEKAKSAFEWLVEVAPLSPVTAPVVGGIGVTDDEALNLPADKLKETVMLRLAEKQNNPQPADLNNLIA